MHHAVVVTERAAQDDEARVHEPVHERRVREPVGLLLHRPRRGPLRAGAAEQDEESRHARILPPGSYLVLANKRGATRLGFAVILKFFELEARFRLCSTKDLKEGPAARASG